MIARPNADKTEGFLQWVEEHKDIELHVTREGAANSLICFAEDVRYTTDPETGEEVRVPPWLFDTYTDILIKDIDGEYRTVDEIELAREKLKEQNDDAVKDSVETLQQNEENNS